MVRLLLEDGTPINARDFSGATALFAAIEANRAEVARELIARGVDVALPGRSGLSPLAVAAFNRDDALIRLLFAANADAATVEETGTTAMVYAAIERTRVHHAAWWRDSARLHRRSAASLAELVRMMKCYYSNGFLAGCQRMS